MASFSEDRVKEIIAKELEVEAKDLSPEKKFIEDLGADSLDIVELVMALEEEFGLDIPDEDADKLKTVGDAINYLQQHAGKQSADAAGEHGNHADTALGRKRPPGRPGPPSARMGPGRSCTGRIGPRTG